MRKFGWMIVGVLALVVLLAAPTLAEWGSVFDTGPGDRAMLRSIQVDVHAIRETLAWQARSLERIAQAMERAHPAPAESPRQK